VQCKLTCILATTTTGVVLFFVILYNYILVYFYECLYVKIYHLQYFILYYITLSFRLNGITDDDEQLSKNAVKDLFDDINISGSMAISLNEFHLMLSKMNIHLPRCTVREIHNVCDLNHSGNLTPEEFDRFVFPIESAAEDLKKAKFFNSKNRKDIAGKGKQKVSDIMIEMSARSVEQGFAM
jgi:hypothetical protein